MSLIVDHAPIREYLRAASRWRPTSRIQRTLALQMYIRNAQALEQLGFISTKDAGIT